MTFSTNFTKPTDKTPNPWPLNGYAPGKYISICGNCDRNFEGDKRAIRCLECAVDALMKHTELEGQS